MRSLTALTAIAILMTACGDSTGPAAVLPAELTGTWVASSTCSPACSFTLASLSNPAAHTDLVVTAGLTVSLRLQENGGAFLSLAGQTTNGTAKVVNGSTLVLTSGGTADTIDYTVSGATLDLTFREPFSIIDFNGDGSVDPARAHAVLIKQ